MPFPSNAWIPLASSGLPTENKGFFGPTCGSFVSFRIGDDGPRGKKARCPVQLVQLVRSGRIGRRLNPAPKPPKGRGTSGRVRAGAIALPGFRIQGEGLFS